MIQQRLRVWSLVPMPFQNPACISGISQFTHCWNLAWRILKIALLAGRMSTIMGYFKHSLALPFFGIWMKADLFQSCGHCWVFQICWHIECSALTSLTFRILNSSPGIPSHPLALFIVMLPKAHLTSYSRISGSRWVTTPSWLSRSLRSFSYSSSMHSCHLFLISSATVKANYYAHPCVYHAHPCILDISSFLEEISSPSHSIVFLYFFTLFN